MRSIIFITLFALSTIGSAKSETASAMQSATPGTVTIHQKSSVKIEDDLRTEVNTVNTKLSVIQDYNDDFLSVIIWSLSSIGAITIVLIGLNWFQSNRALKKEFEVLQRELDQRIDNGLSELKAIIDKEFESVEKKIQEIATTAAARKFNSIKKRVLELEYVIIQKEFESELQDEIFHNALISAKELLVCSIEMNWDWRISKSLECIHAALDGARASGDKFELQELAELEEVVQRVPDSNKTARIAMLRKLSSLHPE